MQRMAHRARQASGRRLGGVGISWTGASGRPTERRLAWLRRAAGGVRIAARRWLICPVALAGEATDYGDMSGGTSGPYTSSNNHVTVATARGAPFVRAATWRYARACVGRVVHHYRRTPDRVRVEYDGERSSLAERVAGMAWEDVVYGDASRLDFVLEDDRIVWGTMVAARGRNLARLETIVRSTPAEPPLVVELGSGTGRNLLYLKRAFPALRCVGLELSPVSVALARALAERFALDVEFHVCDVTQELPIGPRSACIAFTCHALEQMPRLFPAVLARMAECATQAIALLEPVPELWPWNGRGIASRLRARALDRLRGLVPVVRRMERGGEWRVISAERLRSGSNALNETCEVLLRRVGEAAPERAAHSA